MIHRVDPEVRQVRPRLRVLAVAVALAFVGLGARLADLALLSAEAMVRDRLVVASDSQTRRADIVDRRGRLIATDYPKVSVYADPAEILDPDETTAQLATILPDLPAEKLAARFKNGGRFTWVERHITDDQQRRIMLLGLPGIKFRTEYHRIYPQRELTSHMVGYVGVENQGLAGIERSFEDRLTVLGLGEGPLRLTLDLGVQEVARSELKASVERFKAKGGSSIVLDAVSGELLAAVSLPDFDPNRYKRSESFDRFNRNTQGSYELGSLFKVLTAAMAIDGGAIDITGGYDASKPLKFSRHRIDDFHAKYRWLSVPEVVAFSSNIGAAQMALALGTERQRAYFKQFGLLDRHPIRLPEVGSPQVPRKWREINTVTAAYGHGIAVSPLQTADAVAAAICSTARIPAHVVAEDLPAPRPVVVSPETAAKMRWMMWLTVAQGTGDQAKVPGYLVGGKTGSADKVGPKGGYAAGKILASFVGAFPIDDPRYVVLVMLDEPKGDSKTYGQAHGGWTAAPTVGRIISRSGPLLGLPPSSPEMERWFVDRLAVGEATNGRLHRAESSFRAAPKGPWLVPGGGDRQCGCGSCSMSG